MRIATAVLALGVGIFLLRVEIVRPSSNAAVLTGICFALAAWGWSLSLVGTPLLLAPLLDRRWPIRVRMHLAGSELLGYGAVLLPRLLSHVL